MSKNHPSSETEPSATLEEGRIKLGSLLKMGKSLDAPYGIPVARSTNWKILCDAQLRKVFGSKTPHRLKFAQAGGNMSGDSIDSYDELREKLALLESFIEGLDFEIEHRAVGAVKIPENSPNSAGTRQVFVVHGHDEATKLKVARFLEKLDLFPIVLHEQTDRGQTIIEKFERHAAQTSFAVVLLTPDDVGCAEKEGVTRPRARQNVILEMGYFIGKLGRSRVCTLYASGVEVPSDLLGVIYTPLDTHGAWEMRLAKELRAAGYDVDMNKL